MSVRHVSLRRTIGILFAGMLLASCTSIGPASDSSQAAPPTTGGSAASTGVSGSGSDPAPRPGGRVTVAVAQSWDAYNSDAASGRGPWNFTVDMMTKSAFWYLDPTGKITRNRLLGDYRVVKENPLTVQYTIDEKAVWSDGEPIGYADVLLDWATRSGTLTKDGKPLFSSVRPLDGDPAAPEGEVGNRTFTLTYRQPTLNWETNLEALLPAHVVAKQAGMTVDELVEAIRRQDVATLQPAATFWNTGWQYTADSQVPDPDLIPSSGPYRVVKRDGSSLILERNEKYWGPRPALDQIVLRTLDPNEQAQALINGEVDIVEPQALVDVYQQLKEASGVRVLSGNQFAYVHADFRMDSPVFRDLKARQAFAHCIPREEIVTKLIAPVQPDAQVLDLRNIYPFQPAYQQVRARVSGADDYAKTDIARAKTLLDATGQKTPKVVIVVPANDKRLAEAAAMVADSCGKAGFSVSYETVPSLGDRIEGDSWDIALFQWASQGQLAGAEAIYGTGQPGNFGRYSNPEVDKLFDKLNLTTDQGAALELMGQVEQALWTDMVTVPLYAQPQIVAVADRVKGVELHAWPAGLTSDAGSWTLVR